jgi:hypothetical protein
MAKEGKVEVKYSILCAVGRLHTNFDLISEKVREKIDDIYKKHSFEEKGNKNDHESWYVWKRKIPITFNDSEESCDIVIKHFKVRIIVEVTRNYDDDNLVILFRKSRKERYKIMNNEFINKLLKLKIDEHVDKIYFYPLIQIFKEYKSKDFNKFDDENESISSFLYEVPDARRDDIFSLFFKEPKKTIIRVSHPSIITTEMSQFMLSKIINAIYDTVLHSLRRDKINDPSEEIFHNMRDYIGKVLFDHEEIVSNVEMTRSVNTLSIIMSIGALATILTIIYYPIVTIIESIKTIIGLILFSTILIIAFLITRSKRCR